MMRLSPRRTSGCPGPGPGTCAAGTRPASGSSIARVPRGIFSNLVGTPDAASIGYSASHGCIRMRVPDAEWLFNHVRLGTPVAIVDA